MNNSIHETIRSERIINTQIDMKINRWNVVGIVTCSSTDRTATRKLA